MTPVRRPRPRRARFAAAAGAMLALLSITGCAGGQSGDAVADVEELRGDLVARAKAELPPIGEALAAEPAIATVGDNGGSGVADRFVGTLQVRAQFDVEAPSDRALEEIVRSAGYDGDPSVQEGFYSADDGEGWRLSLTYREQAPDGPALLVAWDSPSLSLDADDRVRAREAGLIEGTQPLDEAD